MTTTISNAYITAKINPKGAELFSLKSNNSDQEYIWEGNPAFWGKHSPILFPIVGTLKKNTYKVNNSEYQLSRHGFARDMTFELIDKKEDSATFSIQSSAETLKVYPFEFELQIHYSLEDKKLNIAYKVINKNQSKLPFSIGAHPAFALDGSFEDYQLEFEKEEALVYNLLENDLISNKTQILETKDNLVKLNYKLFENDALIFKNLQSRSLTILKKQNPFLKVDFQGFPHLGIWTKKDAPFICIEPWYGYSDTDESTGNIFEKEGIQIIEANEVFNSKFTIETI
ncbi:aldose 1-epimerase family protein [Flavobacterium undicola]|uniref:aldose 1-epimerase family protein n=1 Tax=Flavobacterium undicola TaxID=1932779 RepID=UPI001378AAE6|nr:aldose 1-epimerase family protein [Flavobacterium undicola]MBA0883052.1 aldose 1-epimerase family protein [Flavobacterium undicola]